jgi:predicted O-methyltransferase YrrM
MSKYFSMMTKSEQLLLARTARSLAPGSHIVEVGSWLMGSARIMSQANPQAEILCVDPFSGAVTERESLEFLADYPEFQGLRTLELAQAIVKDLDNITLLAAVSPYDLGSHPEQFDLYFEDGNHRDPLLKANLDYWLARLKPGGILALHDNDIPDVNNHIQQLLAEGYTILDQCDSLTVLIKPPCGSEAAAKI